MHNLKGSVLLLPDNKTRNQKIIFTRTEYDFIFYLYNLNSFIILVNFFQFVVLNSPLI